jgi:hypothetical protein
MELSLVCLSALPLQVGDVLVERTVGETLPAVRANRDNLKKAIDTLKETHVELEKAMAEFQVLLLWGVECVLGELRDGTPADRPEFS